MVLLTQLDEFSFGDAQAVHDGLPNLGYPAAGKLHRRHLRLAGNADKSVGACQIRAIAMIGGYRQLLFPHDLIGEVLGDALVEKWPEHAAHGARRDLVHGLMQRVAERRLRVQMDSAIDSIVEAPDPGGFIAQFVRNVHRGPAGERRPGAGEQIEVGVDDESIGDLNLVLARPQSG